MGRGDGQTPKRGLAWLVPSGAPSLFKDMTTRLEKGLKAFDCQMEVAVFCNSIRNLIISCYFSPNFSRALSEASQRKSCFFAPSNG